MKPFPLLMLLTLGACAAPGSPDPQPQHFFELDRGAHANFQEQSFEMITEQDRLEAVWRRIGTAPPALNLRRSAVVALFLGQRSSGGHSVAVTRIELHDDTLHVWVRIRAPGPGCMTTQALTSPYQVVSTPLVAVPGMSFRAEFHTETERVTCE